MAGLLDGLLGSSFDDPQTMGLLQVARALQTSPRAMQGLSGGLLAAGQTMQAAKQQQAMDEMRKMQMAQHALQLRQMQQQADQADMDRTLTQKAAMPIQPIDANQASGIAGPRPQALGVVGQQPAYDPRQFLAAGGSVQGASALGQMLAKQQPKLSKLEPMRGPDGQLVNVAVFEDGTTKVLPYGVRPEMVLHDMGGKVAALDKNALPNGATFNKTMTPGEVASNSLGRARLNFDMTQADKPQYDGERGIVVDPRRGLAAPVTMGGAPIGGKVKDLTESQGNAAAFSMRAQNALDNLSKADSVSNGDYWASKLPWGSGNFMLSENGQRAINAEKQFIAAVLRKESGAAISNGEYSTYGEQFFPRPGDTQETLRMKAQNRSVALEGLKVQAGPHGASAAAAGLQGAQAPRGVQGDDPLGLRGGTGGDQSDPFGLRGILQPGRR